MTYIPINNPPYDLLTSFPAGYTLNQKPGYLTSINCFASASVNLNISTTSVSTLFVTENNRGNFFPILVTVSCQEVYSGNITNPVFSIGWNSPNYSELISNQSLTRAQTSLVTFGTGNYEIFNIGMKNSANPGTDIKINISTSDTGVAKDVRTISIFGFYTG